MVTVVVRPTDWPTFYDRQTDLSWSCHGILRLDAGVLACSFYMETPNEPQAQSECMYFDGCGVLVSFSFLRQKSYPPLSN